MRREQKNSKSGWGLVLLGFITTAFFACTTGGGQDPQPNLLPYVIASLDQADLSQDLPNDSPIDVPTQPELDTHPTDSPSMNTHSLVFVGEVWAEYAPPQTEADMLSSLSIEAWFDRDNNGVITTDERVSTEPDVEGDFRLTFEALAGERVVLSVFDRDRVNGPDFCLANYFQTFIAQASTEIEVIVELFPIFRMTCEGGSCQNDGSGFFLDSIPEGVVSAFARSFDPADNLLDFPGGFEDHAGNLIQPLVFGVIELFDDAATPVSEFAEPLVLCIDLPPRALEQVVDQDESNATIDLDIWSFSALHGLWAPEGQAPLYDANRELIAESQLPAVRAGTVDGVMACAPVTHQSYWTVGSSVDEIGCLQANIVDGETSSPAAGARVEVHGVSFVGRNTSMIVADDGTVCIPSFQSATDQVSMVINYEDQVFDGGIHSTPAQVGRCGSDSCSDLGSIILDNENQLDNRLCALTGIARDADGEPLEMAWMEGWDCWSSDELVEELCGIDPLSFQFCSAESTCHLCDQTDAAGRFDLLVPYERGPMALTGNWTEDYSGDTGVYGERFIFGCPSTDVDVYLDRPRIHVHFDVQVDGDVISWSLEEYPATEIIVWDSEGQLKWWLENDSDWGGFSSPVTYGTIPDGIEQFYPETGTPVALEPTDWVTVYVWRYDNQGNQIQGCGTWPEGSWCGPPPQDVYDP